MKTETDNIGFMKQKNIIKQILWAMILPSVALFVSCDNERYMKFDLSNSGIYFTKDTLNYSFSVTPPEVRTYTYKIPVQVLGGISDVKRNIGYYIDYDLTTAEEGVQFTFGEACIMPDSITGYIPVIINRDNLAGDYKSGYTYYKLCIRLAKNNNFAPALDSLRQVRILNFDNSISQPEWYNAYGEKVWPEKYLGKWHPLKFRKMVGYFHDVKRVQPETYKKMVALYGENLEHIEYGDPYQYRTIFIKYIYDEMYQYFNNPSNKAEIEAEFPDFFEEGYNDMPDPYTVKQ